MRGMRAQMAEGINGRPLSRGQGLAANGHLRVFRISPTMAGSRKSVCVEVYPEDTETALRFILFYHLGF
jgi:hypothetical protein